MTLQFYQQAQRAYQTSQAQYRHSRAQFDYQDVNAELKEQLRYYDEIDAIYGYRKLVEPGTYMGYLLNVQETLVIQDLVPSFALECYFITEKRNFKVQIPYKPYVLLQIPEENLQVLDYIHETFAAQSEKTQREDSSAPNHVAGQRTVFYKIVFSNRQQMNKFVRVVRNPGQLQILREDEAVYDATQLSNYVIKIAEFDVPDSVRAYIDLQIRCGCWYDVCIDSESIRLVKHEDSPLPPRIRCLAYDIETSKAPLCFPNAQNGDAIMCISYMLDGFGVLIVNRAVFSSDIYDFEYSPTPEMQGKFKIFNCGSEFDVIRTFFAYIKASYPHIIVTYNGDQFDFKFIDERCTILGMSMQDEIGFARFKSKSRFGQEELQFLSRPCVHIDCFRWVKRDSYLPQGSQGLKAVCREKLKYQPMELDPEVMTPYAKQKPYILAQYSVSDAVATFYLYHYFIHAFILALCTIIPLGPDHVLRKGTGTLCENLLMVKASKVNLLYPDKISSEQMKIIDLDYDLQQEKLLKEALPQNPSCVNALAEDFKQLQIKDLSNTKISIDKMRNRRLLHSYTYVGGRVEALHSGIYRNDLPTKFATNPNAAAGYQQLLARLQEDMLFFVYDAYKAQIDRLQKEKQFPISSFFPVYAAKAFADETFANFDQVRGEIAQYLYALKSKSQALFEQRPIIIHLDVAAMYPNIILTNRLQPHSVVDAQMCGTCDYNFPENRCKRRMAWTWRGIYYPCTISEYQMVRQQLIQNSRDFSEMPEEQKIEALKEKLDKYCQQVYKTRTKSLETLKQATVCERENPFFVDTVRDFRDLRYVYKKRQKDHATKCRAYYQKLDNKQYCSEQERNYLLQQVSNEKQRVVLNESLYLAHKAILNSFYGYAMRAGSRWFSLEMAACVTFIGAQIIKNARQIIELVGSPLELDTDGIWCMLPDTFPGVFQLQYKSGEGGSFRFEYPTAMLNSATAELFSNNYYQRRLADDIYDRDFHVFQNTTECSIKFELDGPYRAMFLSAAKEEGKQIKKRYAVFDASGEISELKGFELKRRGELQLVKSFYQRIFKRFLNSSDLQGSYASAAAVAYQYYDIILTEGRGLDNQQLEFLLQEQTTMKNALSTSQKSKKKGTAITCAARLAQAIDPIFNTVEGLTCVFVISKYPLNTPVSERAIPVYIFQSSLEKQAKFLRMWTGQSTVQLSELLDWEYYGDRFRNCLYRIIVIPAGLQFIYHSPVPKIPYPDWLQSYVQRKEGDVEHDIYRYLVNDNALGDASASEDSESDEDYVQRESKEKVTVEQVLLAHNIKLDEIYDIALLEQAAKQNESVISRSQDYYAWIQREKEKWHAMIAFSNLNTPLRQIARQHGFYRGGKIKSNDIFSQINVSGQQQCVVVGLELEATRVKALLYCMKQRRFLSALVDVPQIFYINTGYELARTFMRARVELRAKKLPRLYKSCFLYEVVMNYADFQMQRDQLLQIKNSPLVKNIFELQVSQIDRFLMDLAIFVSLNNQAMNQAQRSGVISFSDLEIDAKTQAQEKGVFLSDPSKSGLTIGVLSHLSTSQGDVALFVGPSAAVVYTSCLVETLSDEQLKALAFDRFKQLFIEFQERNELVKHFAQYLMLNADPYVVRLRSSQPFMPSVYKQINSCMPGCAIVFVSSNMVGYARHLEGDKSLFIVSPAAVRQSLSENMLEALFKFIQYDCYACVSGVPICNLVDTRSVYGKQVPAELVVCDFLYAKALRRQDFVLWWSKTRHPDIGKDINLVVGSPNRNDFVFERPGHYQGYSINFSLRYAVAEVLSSIFAEQNVTNVPGAAQVKCMQRVVAAISHSRMSTQLLSYLEQFVYEEESALYDDVHAALIKQELYCYLHRLYNVCYTSDIIPVCISQKQLILSTNKIQEHLTTNQLQIYLRRLQQDGLLRIAAVEYNFCYKQLLYLDSSNFYALTITQTLNKRTYLDYLLPSFLNDSLEHIIACFLSVCADVRGVSLLQIPDLGKQPSYFFEMYRAQQLGLISKEQEKLYLQPPLSYLGKIASPLDLANEYEVPKRVQIALQAFPVSIYISALHSFLSLNKAIATRLKILTDSLFTICNVGPAPLLDSLFVYAYCAKCGDFYQLNIAHSFAERLRCEACGSVFDECDIEESLIALFLNLAENGHRGYEVVYHKVAQMRGYGMLAACVAEWAYAPIREK